MQEDIKQKILKIVNSSIDAEQQLHSLNDMLARLNPNEHSVEIVFLCDHGIIISNKSNKIEMSAQLYLIKAKAQISMSANKIHEMKNLTLSVDWWGFALESKKKRYEQLEKEVYKVWTDTQQSIDAGFKCLNQKPYLGVAGYCYLTTAEIYGTQYLQLRLYYLKSKKPWLSKIASTKIMMFLGLDDLLVLTKAARKETKRVKKECFKFLSGAIKSFKEEKSWDHLANAYLVACLEHHSFSNPIRSKIYLYVAKDLIKKHKLQGLEDRVKYMSGLALIGSNREDIN